MRKWLFAVLYVFMAAIAVNAQEWSVYAGAGLSYDGFLRDKKITPDKVAWPFQVGANILGGIAYRTNNGFNIFADVNVGITRIQFPVPGLGKSRNHYEQSQSRLMIGSGPKIPTGNKGNFLTPFIQLGAAYLHDFGSKGIGNDDNNVSIVVKDDTYGNHMVALFGAGIDWQFEAIVPSSVNLQLIYTPLNIFQDPVRYTATTKNNSYDIALQGKLIQIMLSYKVHIRFKKSDSDL